MIVSLSIHPLVWWVVLLSHTHVFFDNFLQLNEAIPEVKLTEVIVNTSPSTSLSLSKTLTVMGVSSLVIAESGKVAGVAVTLLQKFIHPIKGLVSERICTNEAWIRCIDSSIV